MAGLLNAFSSGFLEGARGGALIDATWAAQDEREQAAKDKLRLEADMQEFADLSEKNSGAVMASPEGQQVAGRILMGNPEVRQAINSNVGHEYAGVVKNPKKEDEYFLTVRNPDGAIRPVTVNRETGGIPVAYTGQQLVNMAASSLAAEGADTPEFRQKMGLPAEGDVYQAMAARYPSMGTAEQIRSAATQGKDFIAQGGVPAAKQGTAGVKAAVRAMESPVDRMLQAPEKGQVKAGNIDLDARPVVRNPDGSISTVRTMSVGFDDGVYNIPTVADDGSRILSDEEAIEQFKKTGKHLGVFDSDADAVAAAEKLHQQQSKQYVEEEDEEEDVTERLVVESDKQLMRSPEGRRELARRAVSLMSGGAAQDDGTGLVNQMVASRDERAAKNEAERQALIAKQKEEGTYGARGVGKIGRDVFEATKENVEQNITQPLGRAASAVVDMARGAFNKGAEVAEGFTGAEPGSMQIEEPAPEVETTGPITAQPELKGKPRDAAEVAVEKQRVPAKVFNNSVHVEKLDKAIGSQVAKEPLNERVTKDGEALDRLSKLASGRKPNSRELFLAMRLVKSGILTADQLGKFRETGKLDNVEFDNAYKEQSVRQNWTQLDLAKQKLSFDQFKETMDQQRHMQNQSIQRLKLGFEATKEGAKYADKKATKVYNGVHDVLTADFMGRMQQNPEFKDASAGDVKFFAEAAATRLLNNPTYVQSVLGRDISDIGDAEHLRAGIKEIMPVIRGEGFWSKGSNIPLKTDFKHDPQKVLKGAQ